MTDRPNPPLAILGSIARFLRDVSLVTVLIVTPLLVDSVAVAGGVLFVIAAIVANRGRR